MSGEMEKEYNPVDANQKWQNALKLARREDEKWVKRAKKIVRRYRDDRNGYSDTSKRFNILWSNVQTTLPALYGKTPRAQVERRHKDQDPVGRAASIILERALQYEIDRDTEFDSAVKGAVLDRLLAGRGTAWVRFETKEVARPEGFDDQAPQLEMGDEYSGSYECAPTDYVYWEDFRCSPARTWEEVTWVARRVYMGRDDGIKRFGEDFSNVQLTHEPIGLDEIRKENPEGADSLKKAQVWEIWCKTSESVYWIAEGHDKALDMKEDPYGLDGFWPCPRPIWATQTTDTLVPVPDYVQYQDQAAELDKLTQRIDMLTDAVKVVGVYDASQPSIQRMLSEGVNNTMIPVDSWAAFAEKGGLKGAVDFMPLDQVLLALQNCYQAREQAKQVIYEITGLSDIIRGASVASETATAQQIKSQYASLRLRRLQADVAMFASELLRIKAQLMCDLYRPETLIQMSGIMATPDGQYAEQAIQLMKSEPSRGFRIEVASDSLVEMDEASEKASRTEFMQAFGTVMRESLPMVQAAPEMGPLIGEVLTFVVRTFRGGRALENVLEQTIAKMNEPKQPQQQGPSPEEIQAQAEQQNAQMAAQLEQAKLAQSMQLEQAKLAQSLQLEQFKAQQLMELERMRQEYESDRMQTKAQIDAQTKIEIAAMNAKAAEKPAVVMSWDGQEQLDSVSDEVMALAQNATDGIGAHAQAMTQAVELLADAVNQMNKPKRRVLQRGPDGRAIGVVELPE